MQPYIALTSPTHRGAKLEVDLAVTCQTWSKPESEHAWLLLLPNHHEQQKLSDVHNSVSVEFSSQRRVPHLPSFF
jgi:hypothetical protein